jgi:hypothetical protein
VTAAQQEVAPTRVLFFEGGPLTPGQLSRLLDHFAEDDDRFNRLGVAVAVDFAALPMAVRR